MIRADATLFPMLSTPATGRPPRPSRLVMLVTDGRLRADGLAAIAAAIEGGVNAVHLREKDRPAGEVLALARQLRGICGSQAILLVNDRPDIALLAGADGVHLSEEGLPVAAVRAWLPPSLWVGRSVHSVNTARQAEQDGADYVLAGSIFSSPSHPEREPAGVQLIRDLKARVTLPVVAIGGITPATVAACWEAGADGVAAISALAGPDPAAVARLLAPPALPCD
jgi:thiamine-phosphate pyrophosphorylase